MRRFASLLPALRFLLPGAGCLAMLTLFCLSWRNLDSDRATVNVVSRSHSWVVTQLQTEFYRFQAAVEAYRAGDGTPDSLRQRFDIFASRVPLLSNGPEVQLIRDLPQTQAMQARLAALLAQIEPSMTAIEAGDRQAADAIDADMQPLERPVQAFVKYMIHDVLSEQRDRLVENRARLARYGIGMLALGVLFTGMLIHSLLRSRRMAADIRIALAAAEKESEAKSQFLANMSHELRTPLNAIIGFSEMMTRETYGPIGNARYADYVGDIHGAELHLLRLVNEVLDFERLNHGRIALSDDRVFMTDIVAETLRVAGMGRPPGKAGITLSRDVEDALLVVDERRLRQVLLNLLSNALKFTPDEGGISVTGRRGADGGYVLCVRDTGVGMTPEEMHRAVQPFVQLENVFTKHNEGLGLGLAIAERAMRLHGGSLSIDSEKGVGTAVTLRLPAARLERMPEDAPLAGRNGVAA